MAHIGIRIPNDLKQEWETVVDESDEYSSMSHLIRRAVTSQLASGGGDEEQSTERDEHFTRLIDGLDELRAEINDIKSQLDVVEGVARRPPSEGTRVPDPDHVIYNFLPGISPNPDAEYMDPHTQSDLPLEEGAITASELASRAGMTTEAVEGVLASLKNQFDEVVVVEQGDVTYAFHRRESDV